MFGINFEKKAPAKQENAEASTVEKSPEMAAVIKEANDVIGDISKMDESKMAKAMEDPIKKSWIEKHWPLLMAAGFGAAAVGVSMVGLIPLGIALGIPAGAALSQEFRKEEDIKTVSGGPYFNSPG